MKLDDFNSQKNHKAQLSTMHTEIRQDQLFQASWLNGSVTYKYGSPITISIHLLFCVAFLSGRFTENPILN